MRLIDFAIDFFLILSLTDFETPTIVSQVLINVTAQSLNNNTTKTKHHARNQMVQRAGFEPANPYGKGWLMGLR